MLECNCCCQAKERSYQRFPLEEENTSFLSGQINVVGLFCAEGGAKGGGTAPNMRGLNEVCLGRLV